jgi:hypothetical protein
VWAEQAIYTSISRGGRAGYHLVARSPGLSEPDARALVSWCPSQGALADDEANRASLNFHPLSSGRYVLSRTCQGRPEYSGRGGRQLYTHALILDEATLRASGYQPVALYRDAQAQGHLRYRADPPTALSPVPLGAIYPPRDPAAWVPRARAFGLGDIERMCERLVSGDAIHLRYPGDRIALVECLLNLVPTALVPALSFTTSLRRSPVRPFRLTLAD